MDRPLAVILDDPVHLLLKELLKVDEIPCGHSLIPSIIGHQLKLETKYYTADIHLCSIVEKSIVSQQFSDLVEAVVLRFDGISLDSAAQWLPFVSEWDPQIRILFCDRMAIDCMNLMNAWCLQNQFELIELDPTIEVKTELEEYGEAYGMARLGQMLRSHMWSNADMCADPISTQANRDRLKQFIESTDDEIVIDRLAECIKKPSQESLAGTRDNSLMGDDKLFSSIAAGEDGAVSFEELFSKFSDMKQTVESLPPDERKKYAEKVTLAFWNSVGGDETEIEGLDSSDEESTNQHEN